MSGRRDYFAAFMALMLTVAFVALFAALFVLPIPEGNEQLLTAAAGVLFGGVTGSWGYYFGSSKSSDEKNQTIGVLAGRLPSDTNQENST